jgi:hypothetical protein
MQKHIRTDAIHCESTLAECSPLLVCCMLLEGSMPTAAAASVVHTLTRQVRRSIDRQGLSSHSKAEHF